ncbi:MAG: hypothetical protein ACREXY_01035 [Gammaproteobacteria bacterium]
MRKLWAQGLDSHLAIDHQIDPFEHLTHAALPDLLEDFVVAHYVVNHGGLIKKRGLSMALSELGPH